MRSFAAVVGILLLVSACSSLPRGAGLQSEVLAPPATDEQGLPLAQDFAVETVTRDNLAAFAQWPAIGESHLSWIERVNQPNNRIIAPGDTVTVIVWTTEENGLLTGAGQRFVSLPELRVSPGGSVFLPYLGEIRISGMAPETARERIEERYMEVIPSAQVQFDLVASRMSTVSLVGGVGAPGVYPLPDQNYTVLELLAMGGGVSQALNNPRIRLQRGDRIYGTSVERLLETPRLNTTLVGGDRVYVEADDRRFLSLGAAGQEAVHPFPRDRLSALEAMSIIGGVSDSRANIQGILVLRRYPQSAVRADRTGPAHARTVFVIDLTTADGLFSAGEFLIRDGDLVYVTESPLTGTQTIFNLIGSAFGLVSRVAG